MEFNQILLDVVREDIKEFNETKGRRKKLNPIFLEHSEIQMPYQKYGRIIEFYEGDAFSAVRMAAKKVVPTLLRRKPRPERINLDIVGYDRPPFIRDGRELLLRLIVLKKGHNRHYDN